MNRAMLLLLFIAFVFLAGCGDTVHEYLMCNYKRMVLPVAGKDVRPVCRAVLDSFYGSSRPGKAEFMFAAGPIPYTDEKSGRTGRETCSIAVLSQPDFQEVFVQVKREVPDSKLLGMHSQAGYDRDSHIPATPMESGLNLPASRQVPWRGAGRNFEKETLILDQIKNSILPTDISR